MQITSILKAQATKNPAANLDKPICILGLDPGETTGYAYLTYAGNFETPILKHTGQIKTNSMVTSAESIIKMLADLRPDIVAMEDYRVYSWKTEQHSWASLFTPRLIGAIEVYAYLNSIPIVKRMAQEAKGFCTDAKLEEWGMWLKGERHARDAVRHAVFQLIFGDSHATSSTANPANNPISGRNHSS